ncbi:hypothetical protein [Acidithiobacillus sp.]|uniref:hypothetical protein n=1 Tax=Acidithiobacillus sp. TaxID=1872118 RepID=UPI00258357E7|nr:hypothetical protein [Acidithiobacillus sp.]MDD5374440.1 hypothetical protein [Acidithiobacillus sp.]
MTTTTAPKKTAETGFAPLEPRKLVGVVFHNNLTVFGRNTSQLGHNMDGLAFRWDEAGRRVVVTSTADNGLDRGEEWVHEAAIAKTVWK